MTDTAQQDGGPAFPHATEEIFGGEVDRTKIYGMSLHAYYAGQALSNSAICTGHADEVMLERWFGARMGITREEISAKQAMLHADAMIAMLAARSRK